jgi:hypothetical protein
MKDKSSLTFEEIEARRKICGCGHSVEDHQTGEVFYISFPFYVLGVCKNCSCKKFEPRKEKYIIASDKK